MRGSSWILVHLNHNNHWTFILIKSSSIPVFVFVLFFIKGRLADLQVDLLSLPYIPQALERIIQPNVTDDFTTMLMCHWSE